MYGMPGEKCFAGCAGSMLYLVVMHLSALMEDRAE